MPACLVLSAVVGADLAEALDCVALLTEASVMIFSLNLSQGLKHVSGRSSGLVNLTLNGGFVVSLSGFVAPARATLLLVTGRLTTLGLALISALIELDVSVRHFGLNVRAELGRVLLNDSASLSVIDLNIHVNGAGNSGDSGDAVRL